MTANATATVDLVALARLVSDATGVGVAAADLRTGRADGAYHARGVEGDAALILAAPLAGLREYYPPLGAAREEWDAQTPAVRRLCAALGAWAPRLPEANHSRLVVLLAPERARWGRRQGSHDALPHAHLELRFDPAAVLAAALALQEMQ